MKRRNWAAVLIPFLFLSGVSHAHGSFKALVKIYNALGGAVNATSSGGFQDQAAGYYTGGGLYMRQKNVAVAPLNVSLPHIGVGCNGLDLYMGAFSFLKGEQLVQLIRSIGTGIPTYALQLALKTMSPQVENTLSQIRKIALDINGMMLDSCHASQQIVGGLWPTQSAASHQICQDVSRQGGEDWFGARKHCQDPSKLEANTQKAKAKNKDLLVGPFNLTWHVVKEKMGYDAETATFMMTAIGTVLSQRDPVSGAYKITFVEGLGDDASFLEAYLKGGTTQTRLCDEEGQCLSPRLKPLEIPSEKSLAHKLFEKITHIRKAYQEMQPLLPGDKAFLADAGGLPIYKYVEVSVAARSEFLMLDACAALSYRLLLSQLERTAREVLSALEQVASVQMSDKVIAAFQEKIQAMRSRLLTLQSQSSGQELAVLNQMIQAYEKTLKAKAEV